MLRRAKAAHMCDKKQQLSSTVSYSVSVPECHISANSIEPDKIKRYIHSRMFSVFSFAFVTLRLTVD